MRTRDKNISVVATLFVAITSVFTVGSAARVRAEATRPSPFVRVDAQGNPARWNPCAPLKWKIAGEHPSRRLRLAARTTFRQVAADAGLVFTYAGRASADEFTSPPTNTIVVGATADLGMANAGGMTNVFYATTTSGGMSISGARVAVNPIVVSKGTRFSSYLLPILLHEVGHAVGLAHATDATEIMYPQVIRASRYTVGALADLRRLGSAMGCLSPVTPAA